MPQITKLNNIPLARLLEIKANSYRSKDAKRDYCPAAVDDRINELNDKHTAEMLAHVSNTEAMLSIPVMPPKLMQIRPAVIVDQVSRKAFVNKAAAVKKALFSVDLSNEHGAIMFKQQQLKAIGW